MSATASRPGSRAAALRDLEAEVGVLIRRVRRVIGERARAVHPELLPASYLMLSHVRDHGPLRASALACAFDIDKGATSRQVQHLLDLGLLDREPDPEDGRATLLSASADAVHRLERVAVNRSRELDDALADWSADELCRFARNMRRYNDALSIPADR